MAENNNSMWKIIIGGAVAAALFPSLWYVGNLIVQDQVNKYISTDRGCLRIRTKSYAKA
jgi:hypothetical protein